MSWYSINGFIIWRIPIAKGKLQLGPFGAGSDRELKWYHNPQVPGFRWHWDLGESIGGGNGQRIVQDPGKSIEGGIGQRIVWDPAIKGSIQDHSTWRVRTIHQVVWDPGINVQMFLLWIEVDRLRTSNLWAGGFVIFPFLIQSKWIESIHGTYRGIFPWY